MKPCKRRPFIRRLLCLRCLGLAQVTRRQQRKMTIIQQRRVGRSNLKVVHGRGKNKMCHPCYVLLSLWSVALFYVLRNMAFISFSGYGKIFDATVVCFWALVSVVYLWALISMVDELCDMNVTSSLSVGHNILMFFCDNLGITFFTWLSTELVILRFLVSVDGADMEDDSLLLVECNGLRVQLIIFDNNIFCGVENQFTNWESNKTHHFSPQLSHDRISIMIKHHILGHLYTK
jgi:hypothetical protein